MPAGSRRERHGDSRAASGDSVVSRTGVGERAGLTSALAPGTTAAQRVPAIVAIDADGTTSGTGR
jgi:hypothetical protein